MFRPEAVGERPLRSVEVLDELPERLVIGTGAAGRMLPDAGAVASLEGRGITVDALPTADAVEHYAALDPGRAAAAMHLTC